MSGHGADRAALDAARRLVPYRTLVLLTPHPNAEDLDALRENERLAGVSVDARRVDPSDLLACLAEATRAIEAHAKARVRVHVAGGPNLLTSALLLAAFQRGVEAFYCHARGVSRLPVALDVRVEDRFSTAERATLAALHPRKAIPIGGIAPEGLSSQAVKGALLRLRRAGLVTADAREAGLTAAGAYYRSHFTRQP